MGLYCFGVIECSNYRIFKWGDSLYLVGLRMLKIIAIGVV